MPCGFGIDFFMFFFSVVSLWELMKHGAGTFLTLGHGWQDL